MRTRTRVRVSCGMRHEHAYELRVRKSKKGVFNSFSTENSYVLYIVLKTEIRINVREFISPNEQVDLFIV